MSLATQVFIYFLPNSKLIASIESLMHIQDPVVAVNDEQRGDGSNIQLSH